MKFLQVKRKCRLAKLLLASKRCQIERRESTYSCRKRREPIVGRLNTWSPLTGALPSAVERPRLHLVSDNSALVRATA